MVRRRDVARPTIKEFILRAAVAGATHCVSFALSPLPLSISGTGGPAQVPTVGPVGRRPLVPHTGHGNHRPAAKFSNSMLFFSAAISMLEMHPGQSYRGMKWCHIIQRGFCNPCAEMKHRFRVDEPIL
ncbi:hypothetical protein Pelo_18150 [Pelomyxa schiedti]|nr:hypothetical protein Pelo_18150 [Pelomyxa schiedti]